MRYFDQLFSQANVCYMSTKNIPIGKFIEIEICIRWYIFEWHVTNILLSQLLVNICLKNKVGLYSRMAFAEKDCTQPPSPSMNHIPNRPKYFTSWPLLTSEELPMGLFARALSAPFEIKQGDPMIRQKNTKILHISCCISFVFSGRHYWKLRI